MSEIVSLSSSDSFPGYYTSILDCPHFATVTVWHHSLLCLQGKLSVWHPSYQPRGRQLIRASPDEQSAVSTHGKSVTVSANRIKAAAIRDEASADGTSLVRVDLNFYTNTCAILLDRDTRDVMVADFVGDTTYYFNLVSLFPHNWYGSI